eukprot:scaffold15228_cov123-Skeletonema_marinoi.AAC.1
MMAANPITMTAVVDDDRPSPSVHLHQAVDAELQHDVNNTTTENSAIASHRNTPQQQKHFSLIRLESGRKIWWLDNGVSSHRAEVMLRRRMRYLQEEQEQLQQQQQQEMMGENCYNNVSADGGHDLDQSSGDVDGVTQSICEKGRQYNNISTDGSDDYHDMTAANEPIITAVPSSKVVNAALPMKLNTKITSQHVTKNYNTFNAAVNEVSLESIDEERMVPNQLPRSNQKLLQYCRENNIPVVTVGAAASSCKNTWLDFGEDNVNEVGALSTRQFLIYASARSTALDVVDAPSSVMLEADNCNNNICNRECPIYVTLERVSSKEGFICMLHDPSSNNNSTSNYDKSSLDPIQFQLENDETQLIHVVWNPIHQGCVRENIGLRINTNEGLVRHEIVLVGSARDNDSTTYVGDSSSNAIIEKEEWNGVSVEYSEIREDGSHHDLEVEGVGLTVTEESMECSSVATPNEVDEIAQMMKNASISPKKASMAAKSLSQLPDPRAQVDFDLAVNNRQVDVKQIIAAQEEIDSE